MCIPELQRLAYQYLEELVSEFSRLYGPQIDGVARPYAFIKFGAPACSAPHRLPKVGAIIVMSTKWVQGSWFMVQGS